MLEHSWKNSYGNKAMALSAANVRQWLWCKDARDYNKKYLL